ncbi:hypothetical protein RHGRI_008253 [Rhododendron griersonianum]|uniref:Uncharacterized protein n=1 Tax=Rhododendron griersonianum TaxID=479676 RepID=A0AAV6KZI7_9ERIC|nr:hypothetical protein RHGRI_008253 [Rhododendron griersonianum]
MLEVGFIFSARTAMELRCAPNALWRSQQHLSLEKATIGVEGVGRDIQLEAQAKQEVHLK